MQISASSLKRAEAFLQSCIQGETIDSPHSTTSGLNSDQSQRLTGFKRPRPTNAETSGRRDVTVTPICNDSPLTSPFQIGSYSLRQRTKRESPKIAENSTPYTVKNTPKCRRMSPKCSYGSSLIPENQPCSFELNIPVSCIPSGVDDSPQTEELEHCSPETIRLLELTENQYAEREQKHEQGFSDNKFIYSFADTVCSSESTAEPPEGDSQSRDLAIASQEKIRTVLDFGRHDLLADPDDRTFNFPGQPSSSAAVGSLSAGRSASLGQDRDEDATRSNPPGSAAGSSSLLPAAFPARTSATASAPAWSGPGGEPPDLLGLPPGCVDAFVRRGIARPYEWQRACLSSPRLLQVRALRWRRRRSWVGRGFAFGRLKAAAAAAAAAQGGNLVYALPTSAGKTFVAEVRAAGRAARAAPPGP